MADRIRALVADRAPRVVALDLSRVPDIEYSALQMLQEGVRRTDVTVWLVDLNPSVLDMVRRAGLDQELGPDRLLFNTRAAIARYRSFIRVRRRTSASSDLAGSSASEPAAAGRLRHSAVEKRPRTGV